MLFCDYFKNWMDTYKAGEVRKVTFEKYRQAEKQLRRLAPNLNIADIDRQNYQQIINDYAETHERVTTIDFNRHLRACLRDAVEEGLLKKDPTQRVVMKGKPPGAKKNKVLNRVELEKLLVSLDLTKNPDWVIYMAAKTGARYAEILGITPEDVDISKRIVNINKTWNHKDAGGGFIPTKNLASMREVEVDAITVQLLKTKVKGKPTGQPIFVDGQLFSSTVNNRLEKLCTVCDIPVISCHCLRHTHASLLLCAGVSVASISKRLGHADINTTQSVYVHIVEELRSKDSDTAMAFLEAI